MALAAPPGDDPGNGACIATITGRHFRTGKDRAIIRAASSRGMGGSEGRVAARQERDPRLDFFRGIAFFIIFIAHARGDALWHVIPARFGLSDAANMFVFLSGVAASIAFGGSFARAGMLIGTARILFRCWQLYLAHLVLFFVAASVAVVGTGYFGDTDYVETLGIGRFFTDTPSALVELLTLRYVPHYFDILPLYMAVLAMVPVAMLLARVNPLVPIAASVAVYAAAGLLGLNLPADLGDLRPWYFNPFAWQLIFFTGFALGRGWIPAPPHSRRLAYASGGILLVGLAISLPFVFEALPPVDALRIWIMEHSDKTDLDLLQYGHFLASAYLAVYLLRGREQTLWRPALRPIVKCGQQALSVFLSGMMLSHVAGMVFDHWGTGPLVQIVVNGTVFGLLVAIAYTVGWFKAAPWKRRAEPAATAPKAAAAKPDASSPPALAGVRLAAE